MPVSKFENNNPEAQNTTIPANGASHSSFRGGASCRAPRSLVPPPSCLRPP